MFTGTRSSRARRAISSGSGPVVEKPSDSSTTTAGGAPRLSPSRSRLRWSCSITGCSVVSDVSSAVPIAVPPSACSESSAFLTGSRSAVGGTSSCATLLKVTSPSRNFSGSRLVKPFAALRAASRRFGATSVACIEPEESRVSITVASSLATSTSTCGRAIATVSAVSASRNSSGREVAPPPGRAGHDAPEQLEVGEAHRVGAAPALGHHVQRRDQRDREQPEQRERPLEAHRRFLAFARLRWRASSRSQSPEVESTMCSAPDRRSSCASSSRSSAARAANRSRSLRLVRVDAQLAAGLGVDEPQVADGGQLLLARVAHLERDHVMAVQQAQQRLAPVARPAKVRHDHDQAARAGEARGARHRVGEVGGAGAVGLVPRPQGQQQAQQSLAALQRWHDARLAARRRSSRRGGCPGAWRGARPPAPRPRPRPPCGGPRCRSSSTPTRRAAATSRACAPRPAPARGDRPCARSPPSPSGARRRRTGTGAPARSRCRAPARANDAPPRRGCRCAAAP